MQRQGFSVLIAVMVLLAGFSVNTWALSGSGTQVSPYLIQSLADFDEFANPTNAATYWASGVHTKLMVNINLTAKIYHDAVIAPDINNANLAFDGTSFRGVFDGNNHMILNLKITPTPGGYMGSDYLGLFGKLETSAEIKNLGMESTTITGGIGSAVMGGLCGENAGGNISNCYVRGSVTGKDNAYNIGGLCGYNFSGTITGCYTSVVVTAGNDTTSIGGLCGDNWSGGNITNCYTLETVTGGDNSDHIGGLCGWNRGTVEGCSAVMDVTGGYQSSYIGGLCGDNYGTVVRCCAIGKVAGNTSNYLGGLCGSNNAATIEDSCAKGAVSGGSYAGGLCGRNVSSSITNCYATGAINGGIYVGGLCGENANNITNCYSTGTVISSSNINYFGGFCGRDTGTITSCFWDTDTSGVNHSHGGTGKSTSAMKTLSTFTDTGWDFDPSDGNAHWVMPPNSYPRLYSLWSLWGSGSSTDPYLIRSLADFDAFANPANSAIYWANGVHIELMCDIDLSGRTYGAAIVAADAGTSHGFGGISFDGVFEGNGHIIRDMVIYGGADYLGLFGEIGNNGEIKHLGIEDALVSARSDSYTTGTLCGENYGVIDSCYATGQVTGFDNSHYLGGLCGHNWGGLIQDCYSTASVTAGNNPYVLAGLCGVNYEGTILNCYSTGSITSQSNPVKAGGFCGENYQGTITSCFWDTQTSGITSSAGGTGQNTTLMQSLEVFVASGWDFTADDGDTANWWMPANDYPQLIWQLRGDINRDGCVNLRDFAILSDAWLSSTGNASYNTACDLSGDNTIDIADLNILAQNWLRCSGN